MSKPPVRAEGFAWLTPFLVVKDPGRSLEFYQSAFAFERGGVMTGDDGKINHADVQWQGAVVAMFESETPGGSRQSPKTSGVSPSVMLYVYVPDVDALFQQARGGGATVLAEPADMPWGDRMTSLADLDGYIWNFATHIGFGEPVPSEVAA